MVMVAVENFKASEKPKAYGRINEGPFHNLESARVASPSTTKTATVNDNCAFKSLFIDVHGGSTDEL